MRRNRCPCCFKKTIVVLGPLLNERPLDYENAHSREHATKLAKLGVCPWCGRPTTIVAKILLRRFEPQLARCEREYFVV